MPTSNQLFTSPSESRDGAAKMYEIYHKMLNIIHFIAAITVLFTQIICAEITCLFCCESIFCFQLFYSVLFSRRLTWWINQRMYLTGCQSFSVRERLNKMNRILFQQPLFTDSKAVTTIREHSLESTCFSLVNNLQFNPLGISILLDFQPDKLFDATYIYAMFDLHFTIRNSIDNYLYLSEYLYKCIVYIFNNSISLWCDVVIKYIDDLIMIPYFSSKVNKNSSEHRISP